MATKKNKRKSINRRQPLNLKEKKNGLRQTGTLKNKAVDLRLNAKPPGKRISRSGVPYYERRINRSDKGKRLTGIPLNQVEKEYKKQLLQKLGETYALRSIAQTQKAKKFYTKIINEYKKRLRTLQ